MTSCLLAPLCVFAGLALLLLSSAIRNLAVRLNSRIDVLAIDDWDQTRLSEPERRDFCEILRRPIPSALDHPDFTTAGFVPRAPFSASSILPLLRFARVSLEARQGT